MKTGLVGMRYMVFGGEYHYAKGGFHDYLGSGKSIDDLVKSEALKDEFIEWWHILDTATMEIVAGTKLQADNAPDVPEGLYKF